MDLLSDQKILLDTAREVEDGACRKGVERQASNFKIMREQEVVVVDPMPADIMAALKAASAPIRGDWAKAIGKDKADKILGAYETK